jgi:hypothetical protein
MTEVNTKESDQKAEPPLSQPIVETKGDSNLSAEQKKLFEVLKEVICCKREALSTRSGSLSGRNGYYCPSIFYGLQERHRHLLYEIHQLTAKLKSEEFLAVHDLVERESATRMFKALAQYCSMDVFV